MSRRLLDRSKNAIFIYSTCIWRPRWGLILLEFRGDILHHRTTVSGPSCDVVIEIIRLVVLIKHRLVTDEQTDGHAMTANTALA